MWMASSLGNWGLESDCWRRAGGEISGEKATPAGGPARPPSSRCAPQARRTRCSPAAERIRRVRVSRLLAEMRRSAKLPAPAAQPWPLREECRASSGDVPAPTRRTTPPTSGRITRRANSAFGWSNSPKKFMTIQFLHVIEQSQPRVVGGKIQFHFLIAAEHHYVFHYACRGHTSDSREFKAVPVQMDRMDIVAGIAHANTVAPALRQME